MVVLVEAHGCAIWASGELARRTLAHPNQTASDVVCDALWCGALCDNDCRGIHALFLRDSASIAKCTLVLSLSLSRSVSSCWGTYKPVLEQRIQLQCPQLTQKILNGKLPGSAVSIQ